MNCAECDREMHASKCICGWVRPTAPEYAPRQVHTPAKPETVERFREAAKHFGHRAGSWWTPAKVRNRQQVSLIVSAAARFGPNSMQGRFLTACKEYGCITEDNQLRMRQPGEDQEEAA